MGVAFLLLNAEIPLNGVIGMLRELRNMVQKIGHSLRPCRSEVKGRGEPEEGKIDTYE